MQIYINLLDFARAQVMQVTIVSHLHSVCHSREIYLSPGPGKWAFFVFLGINDENIKARLDFFP